MTPPIQPQSVEEAAREIAAAAVAPLEGHPLEFSAALEMATTNVAHRILPILRRLVEAARKVERETCAQAAEAHGHIGPFDGWDTMDRIAAYSTKTCQIVAAAIRARGNDE